MTAEHTTWLAEDDDGTVTAMCHAPCNWHGTEHLSNRDQAGQEADLHTATKAGRTCDCAGTDANVPEDQRGNDYAVCPACGPAGTDSGLVGRVPAGTVSIVNDGYPWPEDPSVLTYDMRRLLHQMAVSAIREVSEVRVVRHRAAIGASHAVCAKANRLAFDSLRIPYRQVSPDEFDRLMRTLPPRRWTRAEVGSDAYCDLTDTIDPGDEQ